MVKEWVRKELEGIELGDKRLNKRVLNLLDIASKTGMKHSIQA